VTSREAAIVEHGDEVAAVVRELDEEELPVENVYLFEMIMPDADVDVSILCTPGTASPAQSVRVPVTVK
jgi:hypothetical protein